MLIVYSSMSNHIHPKILSLTTPILDLPSQLLLTLTFTQHHLFFLMCDDNFIQETLRTRLHIHSTSRARMLTCTVAATSEQRALAGLPSGTTLPFRNSAEGAVDVCSSSCPSGLPADCTGVFPAHGFNRGGASGNFSDTLTYILKS